ncbi:MAG: nitroreductase family protein [Pseudodesulfovibrio sp.]
MLEFSIDEETCIKCGECAEDCPASVIELGDGFPAIDPEKEENCIQCQHCLTVCPTASLSILGLSPEDSIPLKGNYPDPEKVETLMLGRRSTRRYKEEPVDPALVERMMDVVQNAPTGVNRRSTRLTLVEDKAAMDALRTATYEEIRKVVEAEALPPGLEFFGGMLKAWDKGKDIIYRGAPQFLVASAPTDNPSGPADTLIALSYFEILANSYGVGTVWDGYAKWALTVVAPKAAEILNIPEDHTIGYMMAFGMPAVKYYRTVQRPGGVVDRITV